MFWADAERHAWKWMVANGYPDARLTSAGSDGGVDIRSSQGLAQVKALAEKVGRPTLNQLHGVASAEGKPGMCFSTGGFTATATAWADSVGLGLFRILPSGDVVPLNRVAVSGGTSRQGVKRPRIGRAQPYLRDPAMTRRKAAREFKSHIRQSNGLGQRGLAGKLWQLLRAGEAVQAVIATGVSDCLMLTDRRLVVAHEGFMGRITYHHYKIGDVTVLRIDQRLTGPRLVYEVFGRQTSVRITKRQQQVMQSALRFLGRG